MSLIKFFKFGRSLSPDLVYYSQKFINFNFFNKIIFPLNVSYKNVNYIEGIAESKFTKIFKFTIFMLLNFIGNTNSYFLRKSLGINLEMDNKF